MRTELQRPVHIAAAILAGAVLLIAGYLYTRDFLPPAEEGQQPKTEVSLSRDTLSAIEAEGDVMVMRELEQAFASGTLFNIASYEVPNTENRLILAAPQRSGEEENISCGLQGEKYCGLYLQTPTSSRLLVWGGQLTGFRGVVGFVDKGHAVITGSWGLYNYTSIDWKQVNLGNGELLPLLLLELDTVDEGADLEVSGYGSNLKLQVRGSFQNGRTIPSSVTMERSGGGPKDILSKETLARLAEASKNAVTPVAPMYLLPEDMDYQDKVIRLQLFGEEYQLDLNTGTLSAFTASGN